MLKLNATQRIKRRYLLIEAESKDIVEKVILEYIGVLGWTKAIPQFVEHQEGIVLAIERKSLNDVRAAFELSKEKIKVLRVSGTIKGLGK
ncbi:MAG: hypothetical protein WCK29_00665 [archaeon]